MDDLNTVVATNPRQCWIEPVPQPFVTKGPAPPRGPFPCGHGKHNADSAAARLRAPLIIDAEVVHLSSDGVPDFDALHSRTADENAVALAFDLLLAGDDIRRQSLIERKKELRWVLRKAREGIQYVEHSEGDGAEMFAAICKLGLEGIVSKRLTSVYKSGPLDQN